MTTGHRQYSLGDPAQGVNQSAEFFLSNYRLGKTLGIGSFGKVSWLWYQVLVLSYQSSCVTCSSHALAMQVKVAEHVTTGHKVAIKILNKKKIKHMDMEEKGVSFLQCIPCNLCQVLNVMVPNMPLACSASGNQDIEALHAPTHHSIVRSY